MTYTEIPANSMRSILIKKCEKHRESGLSLTRYPNKLNRVYREFWRRWVISNMIWDTLPEPNGELEILSDIINNDMDRVILDAAVVAWLTIDNYQLHNVFEDDHRIPHDLSYGLITSNYQIVKRIGSFISGLNEHDEFLNLNPEAREASRTYALDNCIRLFKKKMSEEEIVRITNELHY